jgi:selenide, water dikinase
MSRASNVSLRLDMAAVPLLDGVAALARDGCRTGASARNWDSYGEAVQFGRDLGEWQRDLLTDPQTSGGLLIAVAPELAGAAMDRVRGAGFEQAAVIGSVIAGEPKLLVD